MFKDTTKFTVIIPIIDREDIVIGFPKAIKSVFDSTILPDQVLVVVDGPVSNHFYSLIIEQKEKYDLDLIWTKESVGLDKALNIAISNSKNEFIFRADGDDINKPNRFEKQIPYLENNYDLVGSHIDEFDLKGNYLASRKVPLSEAKIKKIIKFRNPFNHMTVAYKKSSVLSVGGYPELFLKGDYGLWINLVAAKKKIINLNETLVNATTGSAMIKRRGGFEYIISEYLLQIHLLKNRLTDLISAIIIFSLRSSIFLLPTYLRSIIYTKLLRTKQH